MYAWNLRKVSLAWHYSTNIPPLLILQTAGVVFWSCDQAEEEHFVEAIRECAVEPVSKIEMEESYDDLAYMYGEHSRIYSHEVILAHDQ